METRMNLGLADNFKSPTLIQLEAAVRSALSESVETFPLGEAERQVANQVCNKSYQNWFRMIQIPNYNVHYARFSNCLCQKPTDDIRSLRAPAQVLEKCCSSGYLVTFLLKTNGRTPLLPFKFDVIKCRYCA